MSRVGWVPTTAAALPRCTARLSLCIKNVWDRGSPDSDAILLPISAHSSRAEGPQVPMVSTATGMKMKSPKATSSAYLILFPFPALSAAEPTAEADNCTWEGARVSGQVKSQTRYCPEHQGSSEAPSGRCHLHVRAEWTQALHEHLQIGQRGSTRR